MILVGVLPKALHACENLQVGGNHFALLRTAIAEAIYTARGRPDPHLTCAIAAGRNLDPAFYALQQSVRKFLSVQHSNPTRFLQMWDTVQRCMETRKTYGPCGVLAHRLKMIKWTPLPNSRLCTHQGIEFDLHTTSFKDLEKMLHKSWQSIVHDAITKKSQYAWCHEPDIIKTHKVLHAMKNSERKATLPVIVTAFQTDIVKHKYKPHVSETCKRCNAEIDTMKHHLWQCVNNANAGVDTSHLEILETNVPGFTPILPFVPASDLETTDGSASINNHSELRDAAFAIVGDNLQTVHAKECVIAQYMQDKVTPAIFQCIQCGLVPGNQSINRVELCAIAYAWAFSTKSRMHSDSKYSVDMMHHIQNNPDPRAFWAAPNYDLICFACEIVERHKGHEIEIIKVPAHTDIACAENTTAKWNVLGNESADKAAKQARITLNEPMGDLLKQLQKEVDVTEAASARSLKILSRVACLRLDEANTSTAQPRQESEREKLLALQNWGNDDWLPFHLPAYTEAHHRISLAGCGAGK